MSGSKLINKEGLWTSNDEWEVMEREDTNIYIANCSNHGKVLSTKQNTVREKTLVEGDSGQIWKKGVPDNEGYFTLTNSKKFLTASKTKKLEIRSIIKG